MRVVRTAEGMGPPLRDGAHSFAGNRKRRDVLLLGGAAFPSRKQCGAQKRFGIRDAEDIGAFLPALEK